MNMINLHSLGVAFNCPYCNNFCICHSSWQDPIIEPSSSINSRWDCNSCPIEMVYHVKHKQVNQPNFILVTASFIPSEFISGVIFHQENRAVFSWKDKKTRAVHINHFNYLPNWIPSNFKDKTNLYMMFS